VYGQIFAGRASVQLVIKGGVYCSRVVCRAYVNKLHSLTERGSRLAHYFALLWGLGLRLRYTSGAKSDVVFLRLSRLVIKIPIWGYFGVFGICGVFSYPRC